VRVARVAGRTEFDRIMGKSILIKEEERIEKEFKRLSKFNLREFIVKLDNKIIENFFHKVTRESNPFFRCKGAEKVVNFF
jgi:hypothetical protein